MTKFRITLTTTVTHTVAAETKEEAMVKWYDSDNYDADFGEPYVHDSVKIEQED